jgi:hypothetical protein|tara:strand:+ start:690 stop:860 length:171 start_codon:yes stop_codon:yes gene_type:complete
MKAGLITKSCIELGKIDDAHKLASIAKGCKAIPSSVVNVSTANLDRRASSPFMKVA